MKDVITEIYVCQEVINILGEFCVAEVIDLKQSVFHKQ